MCMYVEYLPLNHFFTLLNSEGMQKVSDKGIKEYRIEEAQGECGRGESESESNKRSTKQTYDRYKEKQNPNQKYIFNPNKRYI